MKKILSIMIDTGLMGILIFLLSFSFILFGIHMILNTLVSNGMCL
jgi:hypothetical protein